MFPYKNEHAHVYKIDVDQFDECKDEFKIKDHHLPVFYFFKEHRPKDPRHLAAFGWANLGLSTYYMGVGLGKRSPRDMIGGIAQGYRWCLQDLRGESITV